MCAYASGLHAFGAAGRLRVHHPTETATPTRTPNASAQTTTNQTQQPTKSCSPAESLDMDVRAVGPGAHTALPASCAAELVRLANPP